VLLALTTAGLALGLNGVLPPPGAVLGDAFGSEFALQDLCLLVAPLILTGLAVTVGLRAGAWNIGAEGQFGAGAIAAAGIGLFVPGPTSLVLPLMVLGGVCAGALWIAVPALARAYAGVSELITTLLLNFVAQLLVSWLATGPWLDPGGRAIATSARVAPEIPVFWGDVHWGLPVAIALTLGIGALLSFTTLGYEIRLCGSNSRAAHYVGIPVRRRLIQVMLLSGALAGLAGAFELAGTVHRLQGGIANNYGYLGVMVAVLARRSTPGVLGGAAFMAVLLSLGSVLSTRGVSASAVVAVTGLVLFYVAIADELAHYRLSRSPGAGA